MPRKGVEQRPSRIARKTPEYVETQRRLGLRVRRLRLERGLTLEKAAEAGSLDLKHWQKVEAGSLNLTLVTLVRIGQALKIELAGLFAFESADEDWSEGSPARRATRR